MTCRSRSIWKSPTSCKEIRSLNGTLTYQIGTRNASTVLRLKDGETQVLAGLISEEERGSSSGIPGLADLPILGRLFSSQEQRVRQNRDRAVDHAPHPAQRASPAACHHRIPGRH